MGDIEPHERRLIVTFMLITFVATVGWWVGLARFPEVHAATIGDAIPPQYRGALFLADAFSAGVIPLAIIALIRRLPVAIPPLLWMHFGGQGYAFLLSIGCAYFDPRAYYGVVAMMLSAATALALALRVQGMPILWGPFQFRPATSDSSITIWKQALGQTAGMWIAFFLLIPFGIVALESALGWRQPIFIGRTFEVAAVLVFLIAGGIGLYSGWCMARDGRGTPLPGNGTRSLVVNGPYRFIRNPMALLAVIQGVSVGVLLQSPLVIAYSVLGAVFWEILVRPVEEQHLLASFGVEYEEYRARVRCWWPRLRG